MCADLLHARITFLLQLRDRPFLLRSLLLRLLPFLPFSSSCKSSTNACVPLLFAPLSSLPPLPLRPLPLWLLPMHCLPLDLRHCLSRCFTLCMASRLCLCLNFASAFALQPLPLSHVLCVDT